MDIKEAAQKAGEAKQKAEKAKKLIKIFMELPTWAKIAILVIIGVIVGFILLILLFTGACFLLDGNKFSNGSSSESSSFGKDSGKTKNTASLDETFTLGSR